MIEISRGQSLYQYKIKSDEPNVIWVRYNRNNARWKVYGVFDTAEQAKAALFALETPAAGIVRE